MAFKLFLVLKDSNFYEFESVLADAENTEQGGKRKTKRKY